MKNIYTIDQEYDWTGLTAQLREDDSLLVTFHSRIQGTRDNAIYRWSNTGLIDAIAKDGEADPESMIADWIERQYIDTATCLQRGHVVE